MQINPQQLFIYALVDPIKDVLFYVGKTTFKLSTRLGLHLSEKISDTEHRNVNKIHYIQNIRSFGIKPDIVLLEVVPFKNINDRSEKEVYWINYLLKIGQKSNKGVENKPAELSPFLKSRQADKNNMK